MEEIQKAIHARQYDELIQQAESSPMFLRQLKTYIKHSARDVDLCLPLLGYPIINIAHLPAWIVCKGYAANFISLERFTQRPVLDSEMYLLNWPELRATRPHSIDRYFSVTGWRDEKIIALRVLPYMGRKLEMAIARDDPNTVLKLLALPENDEETLQTMSGSLPTMLQVAIIWNSINCFKVLMLNGADRVSAMRYAVEYGRVEMIELLEQDGQSFDGCDESALFGYQFHLLKWLFDTGRLTKLSHNAFNFAFDFIEIRTLMFLFEQTGGPVATYEELLQRMKVDFAAGKICLSYEPSKKIAKLFPLDVVKGYTHANFQCELGFFSGLLARPVFDEAFAKEYYTKNALNFSSSVDIAACATQESLDYCLADPAMPLCLSKATDLVIENIENGTINLDKVAWDIAAENYESLVRVHKAGANLDTVFDPGETLLERFVQSDIYLEHFVYIYNHAKNVDNEELSQLVMPEGFITTFLEERSGKPRAHDSDTSDEPIESFEFN